MKYLIALILLVAWSVGATTYTEFYCDSNIASTNINSGDTTNATPDYVSIAGNWNGTDTFTPTDGTFPANSNAYFVVGRWASVVVSTSTNLIQAGSKGGWVSKILTINSGANGTIVLSTTAFSGAAPASQTGTAELRVGGAWKGPYGAAGLTTVSFPFGFMAGTATNGALIIPRVNLRNYALYSVVGAVTHSVAGPTVFQGYHNTPGDGGKATLDGTLTGTSFALFTDNASGTYILYQDLIFANNGTTSVADGLQISGNNVTVRNVVAHDIRGIGIGVTGSGDVLINCEAYNCNTSNSTDDCGIANNSNPALILNCISHDNTQPKASGFKFAFGTTAVNCIAYNNGRNGFYSTAGGTTANSQFINCDAWNNTTNGLDFTATTAASLLVLNCNFLKNGAAGITNSGNGLRFGSVLNCGFGSGAQANAGGDFFLNTVQTNNLISYASGVTPWADCTNGNFSITLAAAKSAGAFAFTQNTASPPNNTVAYPDIGAAQAADTNTTAGASGGSYTFAQ